MGSEELVGWLVDRGYKEYFVREQIVRASEVDRERLFNQEGRCGNRKGPGSTSSGISSST